MSQHSQNCPRSPLNGSIYSLQKPTAGERGRETEGGGQRGWRVAGAGAGSALCAHNALLWRRGRDTHEGRLPPPRPGHSSPPRFPAKPQTRLSTLVLVFYLRSQLMMLEDGVARKMQRLANGLRATGNQRHYATRPQLTSSLDDRGERGTAVLFSQAIQKLLLLSGESTRAVDVEEKSNTKWQKKQR